MTLWHYLRKEIAAKSYVEGRLGPRNFEKAKTTKDKHIKMEAHANKCAYSATNLITSPCSVGPFPIKVAAETYSKEN